MKDTSFIKYDDDGDDDDDDDDIKGGVFHRPVKETSFIKYDDDEMGERIHGKLPWSGLT